MEEFNLYEDLEELHAKEKQEAIEDLRWKEKYEVALSTIQKLQVEKKELNKKIKQLEINFANLLDTARTEIKRKDNQICELRKEKDDICFRRTKPKIPGQRPFNENAAVFCRDASSESNHVNPFSREPRKVKKNQSDTESSEKRFDDKLPPRTSSKEKLENEKRKFDKTKYREPIPRSISREKDQSRNRHEDKSKDRDRSKDRSRHRNRSRDREDERSRHRLDDRNDSKHKDCKSNRSKERSSRRERDVTNKDEKRKRHGQDRSQTRSSDGSWDKTDKIDNPSHRINYTSGRKNNTSPNGCQPINLEINKPRDMGKSSGNDYKNDQTNDSKTEQNKLKNVPNPPTAEKQINHKIEILQIEILKDVKEFKKNKLEAEKLSKPDPIDPNKLATEKSNQFIDALFDDSIIIEEPNDDLYNDLLVTSTHGTESKVANENKKENPVKTDENCNFNFETPERQPLSFDELFGPSTAGSLCSLVGTGNPTVKSVGGSSSDIAKPVAGQQESTESIRKSKVSIVEQIIIIDDSCIDTNAENLELTEKTVSEKLSQEDVLLASQQTISITDEEKHVKTDENFNLKYKTPQKQLLTKVMDDLFGPSPATSICGQKNDVDESSNNLYFEPIMKPGNSGTNEITQKATPSKFTLVVDDSSCDDVITNNQKCVEMKESNELVTADLVGNNVDENNFVNDVKTFKFVELDSSFYSSEDEINEISTENLNMSRDEIESPPFEATTPLKHIEGSDAATKDTNISNEKNCDEVISNISSKSNEKVSKSNCANIKNEDTFADKFKDAFKYETEMDDIEKNHKSSLPDNQKQSRTSPHSSSRSYKTREIYKKDDSKNHSKTSHNYNSKTASEENLHRSSSSRGSREKRHHHRSHHHRHHDNRSKESSHTKSDSNHHKDSHSSRKHSKHNRHHRSSRDRNEIKYQPLQDNSNAIALTNEISIEAGCSPMLRFDDNDEQNDKITDQDQVFFLHCDNISSDDDEIIGNVQDDESKKEKKAIIEENTNNVIEVESRNLSPTGINKQKIDNKSDEDDIITDVESYQKSMNSEMIPKHENTTEIDMEIELTVLSVDVGSQDKVLTPTQSCNVANETLCSGVDMNPDTDNECTTIISSEVTEELCHFDAVSCLSDQQLSQEYHLQNNEKEDFIKSQNKQPEVTILGKLAENEMAEIQKLESEKNDNIVNESAILTYENIMALNENSEEIHSVDFVEADLKEHTIHESDEKTELCNSQQSSQTSIHHIVELDKKTNLSNEAQSFSEENDVFAFVDNVEKQNEDVSSYSPEQGGASIQEISNNEIPVSDKMLEIKINSENSSDPQLANSELLKANFDEAAASKPMSPNHESTNCQNNLSLTKPIHISSIEELPSPRRDQQCIPSQITDTIPTSHLISSSSTTVLSASHSSTKLLPSLISPQKSHNSADELESFHSNSESLSSGRRKKIKTPRKHTDDSINSTNTTMTMISDRYMKSNETQNCISTHVKLNSSPEFVTEDKEQTGGVQGMPPCKDPEGLLGSENRTVWLETQSPEKRNTNESDSIIKTATEELNANLEIPKELAIAELELGDNNELENEESLQQTEELRQNSEDVKQSSFKIEDTSLISPSKTQNKKIQKDEESLQNFLPSSMNVDQSENALRNSRSLSPIESDKIDKKHSPKPTIEEIEKEEEEEFRREVTSHANGSLTSSELCEIRNKNEEQSEEKNVESFSITIKRNRNKKKSTKQHLRDAVKIISNEIVNNESNTLFPGEGPKDETKNHENEQMNHTKDTEELNKNEPESINYANDKSLLNGSATLKSKSTKRKYQQHSAKSQQMLKHFTDSEYKFVRTSNNQSSLPCSEEVLDSKSIETNTNTKKRKRKSNTEQKLDNSECAIKGNSTTENNSSPDCVAKKVHAERKYNKRKTKQILDSSNSNEDIVQVANNKILVEELKTISNDDVNQNDLQVVERTESPCLKEPIKKRKYTKRNSNSSIDSKNRSNELCNESLEGSEKQPSSLSELELATSVENILDKLHSSYQETAKTVEETFHSQNETPDLCLNTNSPEKVLEEESCINNSFTVEDEIEEHNSSNKPKRKKKRKLPRSPGETSEETAVKPKRSRKMHKKSSQSACDTTSCPASLMNHHGSPSQEKSTSNALTPTHHKIFLNDVFPNDPPPVYNANDDDLQYHEIDDRMRSMFQSPSNTQSSNGECTNDDQTELKSCNVTIDETLNQSEEPTQCDTSTSSRKVSLGSNEYVIESIGTHAANVFITRKKCKKRTKVVASVV